MLERVDSKIRQTFEEIAKQYRGCKYLVRVDVEGERAGYIVAYSTDPDSMTDLYNIILEYPDTVHFHKGGYYKDGQSVGINSSVGGFKI